MKFLQNKKIEIWVLKGFLVFALLFPAIYSPYTDVYQSAWYTSFSWGYFCAGLFVLLVLFRMWKERKKIPVKLMIYLLALVVYNGLSLYFNYTELHWYWEQINNTIAFVFLGVLVYSEICLDEEADLIRFLIHCIVVSNVASIIYYVLGYTRLLICNNQFVFYQLPVDYYENRHYWIYSHKGEYALFLVAFVALFVAYREKFKNKWTYFLSLLLLLVSLYLSHSWTGFLGAFLVLGGSVLDGINWKEFKLRKKHLVAGVVVLAATGVVGAKILAERNLLTLGKRTLIWPAALEVIKKYPQGWGMRFGESAFWVTENWMTNNAHNVFLNQLLRFSVPVGICFTVLFLAIVLYSLWKAKSFLAVGMWGALLILMNMDYTLMSNQMAMLFLVVYLVCFHKKQKDLPEACDGKSVATLDI